VSWQRRAEEGVSGYASGRHLKESFKKYRVPLAGKQVGHPDVERNIIWAILGFLHEGYGKATLDPTSSRRFWGALFLEDQVHHLVIFIIVNS
jgi:hypothetical protein